MKNKRIAANLELAKQVAEQSHFKKIHIGCVITYKNLPIALGYNSHKTHPLQKKYNRYRTNREGIGEITPKRHAEINALSKIKREDVNPEKMVAYIYRIKIEEPYYGLARPCPSCMKALKDFGIKKIVYTTNDGYAEETIG